MEGAGGERKDGAGVLIGVLRLYCHRCHRKHAGVAEGNHAVGEGALDRDGERSEGELAGGDIEDGSRQRLTPVNLESGVAHIGCWLYRNIPFR